MHSVAEYDILQLINIAQVKQLLENHHTISGMAYGIFDTDENNLIAVGWQDICTRFHRVHPDCMQRCRESDAYIKAHLHNNDGGFLEYRCKNGMVDIAMPIIIDGEHIATFFTGQFFYDDDGPDEQYFRVQAEQFGFDRESYLSALQRVPVFSRNHVLGNVLFLCEIVKMLAESGLKNLRLADEIAERSRMEKRLVLLDFAMDHVGEAAYIIDEHARFRYVNGEACRTLGYTREGLLGMTVADIDLDMSPELWSESWQHFQSTTSVTVERRHWNSMGSLFPVEITSTYFEYEGKALCLALARNIEERKLFETKLNNSRDFLFNVINAIADPVFVKDAKHRMVLANNAECILAGCALEQRLGSSDYDFFPKEQSDAFWKNDELVLASGEPRDYEECITDAAGRVRTVVTHKSRYTDGLGNNFVVGVARDISDQKASQQDLRESQQRFRDIFDNSLDCLYLLEVTEDGRFRNLEINPAFEQSTGLSRAELIGKYIGENVSAQTADKVLAKYRRCLAAETPTEEEVELDLPSGKHWYQSSLIPVRDDRGRIHRLVGISRDITGRKRMEEQLRASERQIRTLADNSPGVIYSYLLRPDRTSCLPYVSSRIAELNGLSPSAVKSDASELLATIHPDDLAGVHASIEESARALCPWHTEFRFRHPTKGDIWVEGRSTPERQADGGILWSGFICDITEQKKMEKELFAAKKMEIIGQLAGGVAHEVRNPLNAILSISEALFKEREIANNPEYKPFLEHIRNQVNRLSKLMNDLLNLGKPSKSADLIPVALDRLCADTIGLWNLTEISRLHPVVMQGEQMPSPVVLADSTRLSQSLLNLIENAARCSPTDSPIALRIRTVAGQRISLQVQDSGLGIAEDKLDRVFEPFFTMHRKGTGLGLTLVKHFIENMGGAVHLHNNQPPPGCTAEILLNIAKDMELDHEKENTLY